MHISFDLNWSICSSARGQIPVKLGLELARGLFSPASLLLPFCTDKRCREGEGE